MKEIIVNNLIIRIKKKHSNLNQIKLEEIKYGLYGLYTLITKTLAIILLTILLNFFKPFIKFFILYGILRGVGYGTHAKSNIECWIFSTILLIGIPYLFNNLILTNKIKLILWAICFINYFLFCPADTEKRPMINKMRKLKFKITILLLSTAYLYIIINYKSISNLVIASMILEALLTNPLGYMLMGQKVRFKLNDFFKFKQNDKEV